MFEHLFSRHADANSNKIKEGQGSEKYPGITKEGERVSTSFEKISEIAAFIENTPDGAVIVMGAVSGAVRTRSTLEAYTDGLKEHFKGREDIVFVPDGEDVIEFTHQNPDRKVVIAQPLRLKHLAGSEEEWEKWGWHVYKAGIKDEKELGEWLDKKEGPGPDAKSIAEGMLIDIDRGEKFTEKVFSGRPIVTINVSHSFELSALAAYLANGGEVDAEAFQKTGGKEIENNELLKITRMGEETVLEFKGNKFTFEQAEPEPAL